MPAPDGPSPRNLLQYWLHKLTGSRLSAHDELHFGHLQEEVALNLAVILCIALLALFSYLHR